MQYIKLQKGIQMLLRSDFCFSFFPSFLPACRVAQPAKTISRQIATHYGIVLMIVTAFPIDILDKEAGPPCRNIKDSV